MKGDIKERCQCIGVYMVENNSTVREVARKFGISKSTVHKDLTKRLPIFIPQLYQMVRKQIAQNMEVRHIHGGEATRRKYQSMKQCK